ncbi:hypothetical protein [Qipengyuania sp. ASV99]|uniref:hypothetical protein n=1 Tax=Qipengyuania sp. ASV99 TaxID=3399681 RepID=UPI003A4C5A26
MSAQKAGGWSAISLAASYTAGFGLFAFAVDRTGYQGATGELAFALNNSLVLSVAMILLYIMVGAALIPLSFALAPEEAPHNAKWWGRVGQGFGVTWSALVFGSGMIGLVGIGGAARLALEEPERAATVWQVIGLVQNALGGGIEVVGGLWSLIFGSLALGGFILNRALGWLGIVIGIAGMATIAPPLADLAMIFGLAQIVWFGWAGGVMLRQKRRRIARPGC